MSIRPFQPDSLCHSPVQTAVRLFRIYGLFDDSAMSIFSTTRSGRAGEDSCFSDWQTGDVRILFL